MYVAVEGALDAAVFSRILEDASIVPVRIASLGGRDAVKAKIAKFKEAANHSRWLVAVDLDDDACPPALVDGWLAGDKGNLIFRVAVREIEAWLLADRSNFAKFLSVGMGRLPVNVEQLVRPKDTVVDLARESKKREIREGLVPRVGSGRRRGPRYTELLSAFVRTNWSLVLARSASVSLDRCLRELHQRFRNARR